MVSKTTDLNGASRIREDSPPVAMARNVAEVTHDAITLGELQLKLMQADWEEGSGGVKFGLVAIVVGALALLSCLPVLLIGLGFALTEWFSLSASTGMALSGLLGLVSAILSAVVGYFMMKQGVATFGRSKQELRRNVLWIKSVLKS